MPFDRRQVLMLMASAPGAATAAGDAASTPMPATAPPTAPVAPAEKVQGIGGFFFRAADPKMLGRWYFENLGIAMAPTSKDDTPWRTEAGVTAFTPFSKTSKYLGPPTQAWMMNFRVRDLDRMVAQLRARGVDVEVDAESYPYGRFARLHDPEGNPIELWQPAHDGGRS